MHRHWDAAAWNGGACDVVAVAVSRMYGLPMAGAFEHVAGWEAFEDERSRKDTGFLIHCFNPLPDGRAVDASGIVDAIVDDPDHRDPNDRGVAGLVVRPVTEESYILTVEREFDYATDVDCMGAGEWVLKHLGPTLEGIGIPLREPGPHLSEAANRTILIATGRWDGPDEDDVTPEGRLDAAGEEAELEASRGMAP